MTSFACPRSLMRLVAMVLLAYALVLNGLLGAMGAGTQVAEARTAAQLGVICTIHGIGNAETDNGDPTPGKLACIEQCVLFGASTIPGVPLSAASISQTRPFQVAASPTIAAIIGWIESASILPQPRGPPLLI